MSLAALNISSTFATIPRMTDLTGPFHDHRQNIYRVELSQRLRDARIRHHEQKWTYFIPLNKQQELITESVIEDEIQKGDAESRTQSSKECARWTYQQANKLFTILSYMGKGGVWIYQMYKNRISDDDLPLEPEEDGTTAVRLRRKKDKKWWVLVPEFDKQSLECREFSEEIVLPLMGVKDKGAPDEAIPQMKVAGFSTVTAYRIHSAHHNFWSMNSVLEDEQPCLAIKTLLDTENEEEYEKERSILVKLGPHKHRHLIKLLATYRFKNHYHFIFPCAQANLRTFWALRKDPTFDGATLLWSFRQMHGLTSALRLIHNFKTTIDLKPPGGFLLDDDSKLEVEEGEEKYGRHGDIKPENILWFKEPNGMGILRITDFGLGRFHGRESRSNVDPKTVNATPTYEPPECKLEKPVSRAYDIWSLACLYLEFVTWLLEGTQAIHDFADARGERGEQAVIINENRYTIVRDKIINDDNFFTILRDEKNLKSAVVREAVIHWVERLHMHKNCSEVLHELLDLVMGDLLRPDSRQRILSTRLEKKMTDILERAKFDSDYLLKPSPRASQPISSSSAAIPRSLSKKAVRFGTWPSTIHHHHQDPQDPLFEE